MTKKELLYALKDENLTKEERWLILFLLFIKFLMGSFGLIFTIFLIRKFFKYFLKELHSQLEKNKKKFTGMGQERTLFFFIVKVIILAKKERKIPTDYFRLLMHLLKKSVKKIIKDHPYADVGEQAGYLLEYYGKPNHLIGLPQPLPKIYYDAYDFLKEIFKNSK
jgi:hypothetical protein